MIRLRNLSVVLLSIAPIAAAALSPSSAVSASGSSASSGYDAWYVLQSLDGTAMMKWHEVLEPQKDQLRFTLHIWKLEEGNINEETEGAFSNKTPDLEPKFFNLARTFQGKSLQVDGSVQGRQMVIKVRNEGESSTRPARRMILGKGMILNAFFPVWLRTHHAALKEKTWTRVTTLPEDDPDLVFSPAVAQVRKSGNGIEVDYRGLKSSWILGPDGVAKTIDLHSLKARAIRITAAEAAKVFAP